MEWQVEQKQTPLHGHEHILTELRPILRDSAQLNRPVELSLLDMYWALEHAFEYIYEVMVIMRQEMKKMMFI